MPGSAARIWYARLSLPAAVAAAVCLTPAPAPTQAAGYVASVNGDWFTSAHPNDTVRAGRVVQHGEEVWAGENPSRGDYITLVLWSGERITWSCSVPGDCEDRHTLRRPGGGLTRAVRIVEEVMGLMRQEPERYVSLLTRGTMYTPTEAVLPRRGGRVDVSPALRFVPAGRYAVWLVPWSDEAACTGSGPGAPAPPPASWRAGERLEVAAPAPGLYLLCVQGEGGAPEEAWVLAADENRFPALDADFEFARELTCFWGGQNARADALGFLRAYLHGLAGRGGTPWSSPP